MFCIRPIAFFAVAGFLMDMLFHSGLLVDTYFADSVFRASQTTQGLLGGVSAVGYAIGCLFFGPLSKHSGRRAMTIAAVVGLIICFVLLMFCRSLNALLFLMLAKRFIVAMYWPALMAWLADVSLPQNLGKNLCVFNVGWATGNVVGAWMSGHLGEFMAATTGGYNAQACYAASAILCVILLAWLLLVTPKAIGIPEEGQGPLTSGGAKLFLMQGWIAHFAVFCTVALIVFMFPRLAAMPHLQISTSGQSSLHALREIISLLAFVGLYFTSVWHFRFYPVYAGLGCCAAGILLMGFGPNYATVLVAHCLVGLSAGIVYSISQYYSLRLPQEKGKGSAVHEALIGLAYAVGPAIGGLSALIGDTPRIPFASALVPIILALLALFVIRRRVHDGRSIHQVPVGLSVAAAD